MTKLNLTQICTGLLSLTEDELQTVNQEVVALLRLKSTQRQLDAAKAFKVGMKVKWQKDSGQVFEGVIEKINAKTIKVRTSDGLGLWSISPSLLKVA